MKLSRRSLMSSASALAIMSCIGSKTALAHLNIASTDQDRELVASVVRAMFPHDRFPDGPYLRTADAIIKKATFYIGGLKIDSQISEWFDIWNELTDPNSFYDSLVDKGYTSAANDNDKKRLYVPLQFWFNRNKGLALPLISLQYHEVLLKIELRDLKSLVLSLSLIHI